jgi:valyl-tRNA synthetase
VAIWSPDKTEIFTWPYVAGVYAFWQYNLCDVFIELMKPVMFDDSGTADTLAAKKMTRDTLWTCLDAGGARCHPV